MIEILYIKFQDGRLRVYVRVDNQFIVNSLAIENNTPGAFYAQNFNHASSDLIDEGNSVYSLWGAAPGATYRHSQIINIFNLSSPGSPVSSGTFGTGRGLSAHQVKSPNDRTKSLYDFLSSLLATGVIVRYAAQSLPSNLSSDWAVCDGSEVSRTLAPYKELFDLVGTLYGTGNGFNTYNLPLINDPNPNLLILIKL